MGNILLKRDYLKIQWNSKIHNIMKVRTRSLIIVYLYLKTYIIPLLMIITIIIRIMI